MSDVNTPLDRSRRPSPTEPRSLRLPRLDSLPRSDGLDARVAVRGGVPEVSLRLVLEAGASSDPDGAGGLAELTARLLTEGAGTRDAAGMARWLDRLGAGFEASVNYDTAILSMHLLSDVLDEAIEFLACITREPSFDRDEFDRVKSERLDEIAREHDEPAVVAGQGLISALYGSGLYGRPVRGTHESIEHLEVEAVRGFHSSRFAPGGALLIACGDIQADELTRSLERHFEGWTGSCEREIAPEVPARPVEGPGVILIDRPGSPQTELRVGAIGVPYGTADHHAIIVANAILGGLFNSRINMNLREDKGWTYGARSYFRFRRGAGPFVVRTAVETPATAPAFREVLAEMDRMREEPPGEDELSLAKNALTLSLPLQFETATQIAQRVGTQLVYDLPDDYWERYGERIEAVTPEEVRQVCRTYLTEDRLVLLAVTDADEVEAEVAGLGPVHRRDAP